MFGCGVSLGDVFCVPCHAPENTQLRMTFKLKMTVLPVSPVCCGLMGRVRESRPVSTRPRRPCPPFPLQSPISKGQWYKDLGYFQENAPLMRYAEFRIAGYFVGSGVVEAGCRTLIGERLKRSGMFWSLSGANAIIASRCCQISGRFEDFWEDAA